MNDAARAPADAAGQRDERLFRAGLAVVAAGYLLHAWRLGFVSDDGYIVYRYARNLLDGHGLVYNPGERVDGLTTPLWAVLVAAADWILPGSRIPLVGKALGLASGAAAVIACGLFGRRLAGGGAWYRALFAPALLAYDTSFCAWSTSGLEAPLFTLLALLAAASYAGALGARRAAWPAALVFALATLARPDGVVLFAATAAFELVRRLRAREPLLDRSLAAFLAAFAAPIVPWFAWHWAYYGWPLPNTYYAKVGSPGDQWRRGVRYLVRFGRVHAWFAFPLAALPFLRRGADARLAYLAALLACWAAYVIAVGGDGLVLHRFCSHVAPILYLLVQEGGARALRAIAAHVPRTALLLSATLVAACTLAFTAHESLKVIVFPESARYLERQSELSFPGLGHDHGYLWFDSYFVDRLAAAARWLDANAPPGALVASTPAGSIAFHMRHPVLDMLGLNDEHIAHTAPPDLGSGRAGHEKGDGRYVLARRPEFILLGNVAVLPRPLSMEEMPEKLVKRSEHELWALPEFHRDYERVVVELAGSGPFRWFTFFRRRAEAGDGR